MKRARRFLPAAAILLWALLLLPFFLGAGAAHPATDDFTFALYTHPTWLQTGSLPHVIKDAISYALRTWREFTPEERNEMQYFLKLYWNAGRRNAGERGDTGERGGTAVSHE